MTKKCPQCKDEVDVATISPSRLKNYDYRCLPCVNKWRKKHRREAQRGWRKNWRVSGDVKHKTLTRLVQSSRLRAKKKGISHNLDVKLLTSLCGEKCPILNTPFNFLGSGGDLFNSPSLDRLDNNKGYEKGNIQIISYRANTMKANATPEELVAFAHWVYYMYG